MKKIKKYSQKNVRIVYNSLCVRVSVGYYLLSLRPRPIMLKRQIIYSFP